MEAVTLFLILFLLCMDTRTGFKAVIVMLAVPLFIVGAVWLTCVLGHKASIAPGSG